MIDVRKVNLAYMEKDELFKIAQDAYNEFKLLKDLPKSETVVQRNTLKIISKNLQRYRLLDINIMNLSNDIDDILISDYERNLSERNNSTDKIKSFREVNKHNMCNAKIYPNKYNN